MKKSRNKDLSFLTPKEAKEIQWIEDFHKLFNQFYKLKMKALKEKPYLRLETFLNLHRLDCLVVSMDFIRYLIDKNLIKDFLKPNSTQTNLTQFKSK